MNVKIFCHSLLSDWNHGNAHFLRGIATEMLARGFDVTIYEPHDNWSLTNLLADRGPQAIRRFHQAYPELHTVLYNLRELNLNLALKDADLVLVHEWNDHELVRTIGEHRAKHDGYRLLFHDTHHRSVTDRQSMAAYDLRDYDGVLAFGEVIRRRYLAEGWSKNAWTWHEAADPRVFYPYPEIPKMGDLVWVGNWGDDERTQELHEFLLGPVKELGLKATVYGVRYPDEAIRALADAGIQYGGYLSNFDAPAIFAAHRVTVHVPRRPYVNALPGIPTIRVFEALACGIPLVSAPWNDSEGLFTPSEDFLTAHDGDEMKRQLSGLLGNPSYAHRIAEQGRETVLARHTCAHRVDELIQIMNGMNTREKVSVR